MNENSEYTLNVSDKVPDEIANYEKLYLGKKEMLQVIDNAMKDLKDSNFSNTKLRLGVMAVKGLVSLTDEQTLNVIWNEIIKFTDDLRAKNAYRSDERLETFKNIDDNRKKV